MVLNLSIKFEINLTISKKVIANPQNPPKFDIFHPKMTSVYLQSTSVKPALRFTPYYLTFVDLVHLVPE